MGAFEQGLGARFAFMLHLKICLRFGGLHGLHHRKLAGAMVAD